MTLRERKEQTERKKKDSVFRYLGRGTRGSLEPTICHAAYNTRKEIGPLYHTLEGIERKRKDQNDTERKERENREKEKGQRFSLLGEGNERVVGVNHLSCCI